MGVNGFLLSVDIALSERLRREPELVAAITMKHTMGFRGGLGGDLRAELDAGLRESAPGCLWGWWPRPIRRWVLGRFLPGTTAPTPPDAEAPEDAEPEIPGTGDLLDLHKDWEVVHFLLTGESSGEGPYAGVAAAVLGGTEFGDDVGYGPARLISADEVRQIAEALEAAGRESFLARFDPAAMARANVYGGDAVEEEEAEDQLDALFVFYALAREQGREVLAWQA
jgi:hypothetical protein